MQWFGRFVRAARDAVVNVFNSFGHDAAKQKFDAFNNDATLVIDEYDQRSAPLRQFNGTLSVPSSDKSTNYQGSERSTTNCLTILAALEDELQKETEEAHSLIVTAQQDLASAMQDARGKVKYCKDNPIHNNVQAVNPNRTESGTDAPEAGLHPTYCTFACSSRSLSPQRVFKRLRHDLAPEFAVSFVEWSPECKLDSGLGGPPPLLLFFFNASAIRIEWEREVRVFVQRFPVQVPKTLIVVRRNVDGALQSPRPPKDWGHTMNIQHFVGIETHPEAGIRLTTANKQAYIELAKWLRQAYEGQLGSSRK